MDHCCVIILLLTTVYGLTSATTGSDGFKCPDGWYKRLGSCYRRGDTKLGFYGARTQCIEWASSLRVILNEEENRLFSVPSSGEYFWLGMTRERYSPWKYVENGVLKEVTYKPTISGSSGDNCLLWHSARMQWTSESCYSSKRRFICQRPPECIAGRFGVNCTEECHCKGGEACNTTSGKCAKGCQLGWTGPTCSIATVKAEAKFYCFKIRNENVLSFRVNQRGTKYRSVAAYNKHHSEVPGCSKSHFSYFEPRGMATLKVVQRKNGAFQPSCGEEKGSGQHVTWLFKFQEFPMTASAYDILFEVTCDFNKADTLTRLITSDGEKSSNKTTKLTESKLSVTLDMIDPFTDQPVTTVKLGQPVKLQLKLSNGDDYGVTAISPYNCSVSTMDGLQRMVFRDENGCNPRESQIVFNTASLTSWESEPFQAFTFLGYDKINFRCQFHVCFSEEHNFCRETCAHSQMIRRTRDTGEQEGLEDMQGDEDLPQIGTVISIET